MLKIKKEKPQVKIEPLQCIGRDEMNLAEFPFALLKSRTAKSNKLLTFKKERVLALAGGTLLHQQWTVTGTSEYGLPEPCDEEVLLSLLKIVADNKFASPKVHFAQQQLLKIMDWPISGQSHKRLELALARLTTTKILAKDSFWDNKQKIHVTHQFGIIDEWKLFERCVGKVSNYQTAISANLVRFSETFFASIQAKYIKPIDLKLYFSLKSPITKRLFRYLDKKRYQKERYEIDLYQLASVHIGLAGTTCRYASWIKDKLGKAHHELQKRGFLKSIQYEKTQKGSWKVIYGFGKTSLGGSLESQPVLEEPLSAVPQESKRGLDESSPYKEITEALVSRGVSRKTAQELVNSKDGGFIEKQIDVFDYLKEINSEKLAENPSGFLTKAIRDEWVIEPSGYVPKKERVKRIQAKEEAQRVKQAEEEKERREQEELQRIRESLPVEVLENLRAEALEKARKNLGRVVPIRPESPFVGVFLSELLKERYLSLDA